VARRRFALVAALATLLAAWPAAANAATTVDTTSTGNAFDLYFGSTYETVGQTITPPADAYNLESLSFFVNLPATVSFRAAVYAWDPLQNTECCLPPLWQSDGVSTTGSVAQGSYTEAPFDTGGILLDPAKTYIVLITTYGLYPPTFGFAEARDLDAYAGGRAWRTDTGPGGGGWTPVSYADPVNGLREADLGFKATFSSRPLCFGTDESDPDAYTHPETPVTIALDCRSAGAGTGTVSVSTAPANGTTGTVTQASGDNPATVEYTPDNGFTDAFDSFEFDATTTDGTSDPAAAVVHVGNLAPQCTSGELDTEMNTPITFVPTCTDAEGDPLSFFLTSLPSNGTAVDNGDGTVTYRPAQDFTGQDSFTGYASDGDLESNDAIVDVYVYPPDHPPVCKDVSATVDQGKSVAIQLSCSDPDDDPITAYRIVSQPTAGSLGPFAHPQLGQPPPSSVTYTPRFTGGTQDKFTYAATAFDVESAPATVTITINRPATTSTVTTPVTTPGPAPAVATTPPPSCHVPKLVGKKLKAARALLERSHCALGRVTHRRAGRAKRGRVIKQGAKPGAVRAPGTKVRVTVGA
jgi:hypothetical protein